jgi:hypothetical protein
MTSYPSKFGLVDSARLCALGFSPTEVDRLVHLAHFALQQEGFDFATRSFELSDDELLSFYDRIGSALGVEPKSRDPRLSDT